MPEPRHDPDRPGDLAYAIGGNPCRQTFPGHRAKV